jgi:hypothetical protein
MSRRLAEFRMISSRRDSTIVTRHEVPGKAPPKEPSRRVRYDSFEVCAPIRDAYPGTSCLATIVLSLRDKTIPLNPVASASSRAKDIPNDAYLRDILSWEGVHRSIIGAYIGAKIRQWAG